MFLHGFLKKAVTGYLSESLSTCIHFLWLFRAVYPLEWMLLICLIIMKILLMKGKCFNLIRSYRRLSHRTKTSEEFVSVRVTVILVVILLIFFIFVSL